MTVATYHQKPRKGWPYPDRNYVEFTLEIRVRLEDGYRLERYGFRLTDGVWTLASIAVAGADL